MSHQIDYTLFDSEMGVFIETLDDIKGIDPQQKATFHLTQGSEQAAGWDLKMSGRRFEEIIIYPGQRELIPTNISLAISEGLYGRIAPRSGLAFKDGINVLAGVIDSDYRGEIKVLLHNTGSTPKTFAVGDRVAQIIFEKYQPTKMNLVESLADTSRGDGGFGSTGK